MGCARTLAGALPGRRSPMSALNVISFIRGIADDVLRKVLPYAPDACYAPDSVKIGYQISFTRYFYQPQPLRSLEEIPRDIMALEWETEGPMGEIVGAIMTVTRMQGV